MLIPLPPLEEQKRIAAILDKADAIRRKRQQALQLADEFLRSLFLTVISDRNTYNFVDLSSVCTKITDGTHKTPTYVAHGIPFITARNVVGRSLNLQNTKRISEAEHRLLTSRARPELGDLLVTKDGTIGETCVVEISDPFSIFVSVALLKPNRAKVLPHFLAAQLQSPFVQKQIIRGSKGIAIRHLHLADFKTLKILLPPMHVQRAFVDKLSRVHTYRAEMSVQASALAELQKSLTYRAFQSEL
jgi:type I restriction enzyme S subunit